ncbi:hypothetical protein C8J56DRAFT_1050866 [Mycena floridula]|nr:hypothetical protein C8J56DRAFT_1050866 [Mycena floridula]
MAFLRADRTVVDIDLDLEQKDGYKSWYKRCVESLLHLINPNLQYRNHDRRFSSWTFGMPEELVHIEKPEIIGVFPSLRRLSFHGLYPWGISSCFSHPPSRTKSLAVDDTLFVLFWKDVFIGRVNHCPHWNGETLLVKRMRSRCVFGFLSVSIGYLEYSLLAHPSRLSSITNATCSKSIDHLLHRLRKSDVSLQYADVSD